MSDESWSPWRSAYHAYRGLAWIIRRTPSLQLGLATITIVLVVAVALHAGAVRLAILIIFGAALMAAEIVNTAVEMLCDRVYEGPDERIGRIKDVAAAATAMCEIAGAAVVLLLLGPLALAALHHF